MRQLSKKKENIRKSSEYLMAIFVIDIHLNHIYIYYKFLKLIFYNLFTKFKRDKTIFF